jgi:hypothetical protein
MRTGLVVISAVLLVFIGCTFSRDEAPSTAELADILGIHSWHVSPEPTGKEWSIEVVPAGTNSRSTRLRKGSALIALRELSNDEYSFVLSHREGRSSGTFRPCGEPENVPGICEGYGIEFNDPPICLDDCSQAILATLKPMVGAGNERWVVLKLEASLRITPDAKTTVTPLP